MFHGKVYNFKSENESFLSIGSSNISINGLISNNSKLPNEINYVFKDMDNNFSKLEKTIGKYKCHEYSKEKLLDEYCNLVSISSFDNFIEDLKKYIDYNDETQYINDYVETT